MSDWASEATDLIEKAVANLRKTMQVDKAKGIAQAIAIGMLVAFFVLTAVSILFIVSFRLLVLMYNQLPGPDNNAWMAWMTLGVIMLAAGAIVWAKRTPSAN